MSIEYNYYITTHYNRQQEIFAHKKTAVTSGFLLQHLIIYSAKVNKLALPPAAVVLMVSVRSEANFSR